MAQTDIIQKDLGLVTAYGYALAGGYQGTEEQFKRDFAALMSGQYAALGNKPSINGVTLVGNKTTADLHIESGASLKRETCLSGQSPFTSEYGSVGSDLIYYGNISYLTLSLTLSSQTRLTTQLELFRMDFNKPEATENEWKYTPHPFYTDIGGGTRTIGTAGIVGFDDIKSIGNAYFEWAGVDASSYTFAIRGILVNRDVSNPITYNANKVITLGSMFFNCVGGL